MKTIEKLKFLFLFLSPFLVLSACFSNDSTGKKKETNDGPTITKIKDVPVLELSGDGHTRGLQHGKELKTEIAEVFSKWKTSIQNDTKQSADSIITAFLSATNFEPAIRKYTPEIYEEIKGIATGSEQSFNDVLTFQLVDEFWVYLDRLNNIQKHHCSAIGVAAAASHPAYVSQNMDLESYMNGYQILLHIAATDTEPEQYILSCAGLIALNGLNEKSIGLCMNTLMELAACTDGLPVACIVRGVLAQPTGEGALKFLQSVPHASGQNYTLGISDKVYDFEASANKVVRYLPDPANEGLVYHTNHPVANDDVKPWYTNFTKQVLAGKANDDNSVIRMQSLINRLNKPVAEITDIVLKETFRSKDDLQNPVCRTYTVGKAGFTFSSVVLSLGATPSIQLTNGSPDLSEYVMHIFN